MSLITQLYDSPNEKKQSPNSYYERIKKDIKLPNIFGERKTVFQIPKQKPIITESYISLFEKKKKNMRKYKETVEKEMMEYDIEIDEMNQRFFGEGERISRDTDATIAKKKLKFQKNKSKSSTDVLRQFSRNKSKRKKRRPKTRSRRKGKKRRNVIRSVSFFDFSALNKQNFKKGNHARLEAISREASRTVNRNTLLDEKRERYLDEKMKLDESIFKRRKREMNKIKQEEKTIFRECTKLLDLTELELSDEQIGEFDHFSSILKEMEKIKRFYHFLSNFC